MMFMDLFPAGLYQFYIVLHDGLWHARTQETINGTVFQTLTFFRSLGGTLFAFGVVTLIWFVLSRSAKLKPETNTDWKTAENDWNDKGYSSDDEE